VAEIRWVAGEDDVAAVCDECNGGIDGVAEASATEEDAGVTGEGEIDRNDVHRLEELRDTCLPADGASPNLRDDDRGGAKLQSVFRRCMKSGA